MPAESKTSKHSQLLAKVDFYGGYWPNFYVKGQERVNTRIGGCLTLLSLVTIILFALVQLQQWVE